MQWVEIAEAAITLSVLLMAVIGLSVLIAAVQVPSTFLTEYLKARNRQKAPQAFSVIGKDNKRLAVRLEAINAISIDKKTLKFALGGNDAVWFELGTEEIASEAFDILVKLANAEARQ